MLVIEDADFEDASEKLRLAGFQDSPWSYGAVQPSFYEGKVKEDIYRAIVKEYSNLDQNSTRFLFPPEQQRPSQFSRAIKVALLRSSYTHIRMNLIADSVTRDGNILYPDDAILLQSFVQTAIRESIVGMWKSCLEMWAISFAYGELMLDDDTLDACDDEEAKAWFNENIKRFSGGIDRVTCTKRLGRVGYDESLARRR